MDVHLFEHENGWTIRCPDDAAMSLAHAVVVADDLLQVGADGRIILHRLDGAVMTYDDDHEEFTEPTYLQPGH